MKGAKPLFEVYWNTKGIILHVTNCGIDRLELIAILEMLKFQQLSGKGTWENTDANNKKWKKRKIK